VLVDAEPVAVEIGEDSPPFTLGVDIDGVDAAAGNLGSPRSTQVPDT